MDLKEGDEVIVPAFTMMSPVFALLYQRVKPVLVDVDPVYWTMDTDQIESKVTDRTRAILVVHTYGNPVDMDPVMELARNRSLFVIEDCAEALGATYKGRRPGTFGDIATFSFFANKLITCGEGGIVSTNDLDLADRVNRLHDLYFGRTNKFHHDGLGYNYRMSALQAALGFSQLKRVEEHLERIRRIARVYSSNLEGEEGLNLHRSPPSSEGSYWMYSVTLKNSSRDAITKRLTESGVETRPFFVPAHLQPACSDMFGGEQYPVSELLSRTGLNLPSGLALSDEEIAFVSQKLIDAIRHPL